MPEIEAGAKQFERAPGWCGVPFRYKIDKHEINQLFMVYCSVHSKPNGAVVNRSVAVQSRILAVLVSKAKRKAIS
ncbi:MAG: hypothetical protein K2X60_07350 [Xanthobacteraceae bacterium]|nr:hypothetical protein [Xanthobacteraceae bacterium]